MMLYSAHFFVDKGDDTDFSLRSYGETYPVTLGIRLGKAPNTFSIHFETREDFERFRVAVNAKVEDMTKEKEREDEAEEGS